MTSRKLAIIPARGGSKRVPKKNVREFHGKPMLLHVLEATRDSQVFHEIHVSTDDDTIASIATNNGFPPAFRRPMPLAEDDVPLMPVLRNVLETYDELGQRFDTIALIYATAALIEADDLRLACEQFETGDRSLQLMSTGKYPAPIEWACRLRDDGRLIPVQPGAFATPSRDLEDAYYDAACFVFFDRSTILDNEWIGSDRNLRAFVLPLYKAIDIDTPEDWDLAERMFGMFRKRHG